MNIIRVDRSRYEAYGRCPRSRYENYHRGGLGIESVRRPLPLCVGGSVHVGLADMLDSLIGATAEQFDTMPRTIEEEGVKAALADFAQYARVLELPDAEAAAIRSTEPATLTTQLMDSMKMETGRAEAVELARSEMDDYLYREQSALVEALVRAYARRRLRPLLEQFEVLEVEREGEWKLGDLYISQSNVDGELWFMSRPDALLRERESNQLYLLSYKTAASWDLRKARDAEHDMQGMSEGVEVERRLADWWEKRHDSYMVGFRVGKRMLDYLKGLDAPPRILAVRYEYMLKGERWRDKELSERFGVEMRSQKSHLIRKYVAVSVPQRGTAGYAVGDHCWSWDYTGDDDREHSLAWQNWKSRAVWEENSGHTVKDWIDALGDSAPCMSGEDTTMGLEPRLLGYKSDAQAVGVTKEHPLDAVFVPPVTVYRQEDSLRDMVEQLEAVERRIAEGVAAVDAASNAGERRHLLNTYFPQTLRACSFPTECAYTKICFAGEGMRSDPVGSGLFKSRTPNHKQELGQ